VFARSLHARETKPSIKSGITVKQAVKAEVYLELQEVAALCVMICFTLASRGKFVCFTHGP